MKFILESIAKIICRICFKHLFVHSFKCNVREGTDNGISYLIDSKSIKKLRRAAILGHLLTCDYDIDHDNFIVLSNNSNNFNLLILYIYIYIYINIYSIAW